MKLEISHVHIGPEEAPALTQTTCFQLRCGGFFCWLVWLMERLHLVVFTIGIGVPSG